MVESGSQYCIVGDVEEGAVGFAFVITKFRLNNDRGQVRVASRIRSNLH